MSLLSCRKNRYLEGIIKPMIVIDDRWEAWLVPWGLAPSHIPDQSEAHIAAVPQTKKSVQWINWTLLAFTINRATSLSPPQLTNGSNYPACILINKCAVFSLRLKIRCVLFAYINKTVSTDSLMKWFARSAALLCVCDYSTLSYLVSSSLRIVGSTA